MGERVDALDKTIKLVGLVGRLTVAALFYLAYVEKLDRLTMSVTVAFIVFGAIIATGAAVARWWHHD
jgi:hypothetical protein